MAGGYKNKQNPQFQVVVTASTRLDIKVNALLDLPSHLDFFSSFS